MKKAVTLLVGLCVIILTLGFLPIHGENEIYEQVVRLHVLAHSDSEEDQALKLRVRDRVLSYSAQLLSEVTDREEAARLLKKDLNGICLEAQECVREAGYDYGVEVILGQERYPTREYESCCFPSGEYLSLQVRIGEAAGQNWWCVLFPPLCLSAASEQSDEGAFIAAGLSGEQYKIITQTDGAPYRVRFKLLEALESMAG